MIVHSLTPKSGLVVLTPEDVNDLWRLRRLIARGDLVASETTRVVKGQGFYTRPDKGERVKVKITLNADKVRLDSTFGSLRVTGKIVDVSSDLLSKGSSHSLLITPERRLAVKKENWGMLESKLVGEGEASVGCVISALDVREAGVGALRGTHLKVLSTITSGFGGKRYVEAKGSYQSFFSTVEETLRSVYIDGDKVFLAGPGQIKNQFANLVRERWKEASDNIFLIDGVDVTGEDGVLATVRSSGFRQIVKDSIIAKAHSILEEAVRRVSTGDPRVAMAFPEVSKAGEAGAVEDLVLSDRLFELGVIEDELVTLLNIVEKYGGRAYLLDSSTDMGRQASGLGGIVALLRYALQR
ncbi:MAG: pelota family protein [Thaumarchaeota archaeon]|nr:pelota family protein [Nitrososphaerota archaeon]